MAQTKVKSGLLNFPDQTDFVKLPSGTTAQRPVSPEKGYSRYNTTDNKLEFWNGTEWQQLPVVVAPIITSISYPGDDLAADPAGGQTITINGSDFQSGATVTVGGTTPSVITFVSATQITFEAPAKASGDYDIVVTNPDGGNATSVNGISYNGVPSWTTPAGNLGSFPAGSTIPTITLVATEPDSGVISYSVTTGALPTGLTLTGADIDGNVPTPAGETTYNFSVTASDDENQSTERAFNIVVFLCTTNTLDILEDGSCIATYQLDGNANDLSGNYNGTASNVTYPVGKFDLAGSFNGIDSYIDTGAPLLGSTTYSVSLWFYANFLYTNAEGENLLYNQYNSGLTGRHIVSIYESSFRIFVGGSTLSEITVPAWQSNNWYHIVVVKNSSGFALYIDGNSAGTLATSSSITTGANLKIGKGDSNIGENPLNGQIDQVRIFNKALSAGEVTTLYNETACN